MQPDQPNNQTAYGPVESTPPVRQPLPPIPPQPPKRSKKKLFIILIILFLVLAAGGAGAYMYFQSQADQKAIQDAADAKAAADRDEAQKRAEETAKAPQTETYSQEILGVEMTIPGAWQDIRNNPNEGLLKYTDEEAGIDMVLTISKGDWTSLPCETIVENSQKIIYTEPLPEQRTETFLSFLGNAEVGTDEQLCTMFISGAADFTKGAKLAFSPVPAVATSLPELKIIANFTEAGSEDTYPPKEVVQDSRVYADLLTAFESLKVK